MQRYPDKLYALGDQSLLQRRALSIVGTRKPSAYTREMTARLASGVISNNKREFPNINDNEEFLT